MTSGLYVSLTAYSATRFGTSAKRCGQFIESSARTFGWTPFTYAWWYGKDGPRNERARKLTPESLESIAAASGADEIDVLAFMKLPRTEIRFDETDTTLSVFFAGRLRSRPDAEATRLPIEVLAGGMLAPAWPDDASCSALQELLHCCDADYACIFVGADRVRAQSELFCSPLSPNDADAPSWAHELRRIERSRAVFGERVRGAYWGNVFPPNVVARIGGEPALRSTGAAIVEPLSGGRIYVQLTERIGDAAGTVGQQRLAALESVLRPVLV